MRALSSLLLVFVMAIALVACGGANSDNEYVNTPDNSTDESPVEEPPVEEPAKPDVNGKLAATMEIELEVEGNVETRTGTLAVSDNGYYLYTLPQFKFTPEEPNADQVYMDKFEDFYMRILTLGAEPDLSEIRANAEEELAMLGDVVEMNGEQIWEPALRDSIFYLHSSDSSLSKYIILREIDGKYFKIIVNMPSGEAQEGAGPSFPAMIKTIQLTRP
ncbi:MAG: hypothetical protein WD424_10930 [Paenibacillaceae bacterium]